MRTFHARVVHEKIHTLHKLSSQTASKLISLRQCSKPDEFCGKFCNCLLHYCQCISFVMLFFPPSMYNTDIDYRMFIFYS